jgi:hypothetical protein
LLDRALSALAVAFVDLLVEEVVEEVFEDLRPELQGHVRLLGVAQLHQAIISLP